MVYVIFGDHSLPSFIDASNLAELTNSRRGCFFKGAGDNYQTGYSVSSAGHFNGDPYSDVIIGAPYAKNKAGAVYVIFGSWYRYNWNIDLSALDSEEGLTIEGKGGFTGLSVSGAGNVNGRDKDGNFYDDIIIGAPYANNHADAYSGISYIIYGKNERSTYIDLDNLESIDGFIITGAPEETLSGSSVSGAGDVNNDTYDDIIVGAAGRRDAYFSLYKKGAVGAYVVYGAESGVVTDFPTQSPTAFPTHTPTAAPPPVPPDPNKPVLVGVVVFLLYVAMGVCACRSEKKKKPEPDPEVANIKKDINRVKNQADETDKKVGELESDIGDVASTVSSLQSKQFKNATPSYGSQTFGSQKSNSNKVTTETTKNYIDLQGLEMQSKIHHDHNTKQNEEENRLMGDCDNG